MTARSPSTGRRARLVVAAPLLVTLLVTSWLLWTRGDPARQGGWCANATVEVTSLIRSKERDDNLARDQASLVSEALGSPELVDVDRLRVDTPDDLVAPVEVLAREVPAYREELAAAADGQDRPAPPDSLQQAFVTVMAGYLRTCIRS